MIREIYDNRRDCLRSSETQSHEGEHGSEADSNLLR